MVAYSQHPIILVVGINTSTEHLYTVFHFRKDKMEDLVTLQVHNVRNSIFI